MKRIAVLTSGGDAPGMNAAIRAVVGCGRAAGLEVFGVQRGYQGLMNDEIEPLDSSAVSNIVQCGGTMLRSARSERFMTADGRAQAVARAREHRLDGFVVIGGDGSFRGAMTLEREGLRCIGIPATIDNDIACTDHCIGFDTAVNTVVEAMNKIRDTATSHERIVVVEVMGRNSGYIALYAGLAGGADAVLIPEVRADLEVLAERIRRAHDKGQAHSIILVAEGVFGDPKSSRPLSESAAFRVAGAIHERTGFETRVTILGHLQRGGTPSAADRIAASRFGEAAVELLVQGEGGKMVGLRSGKIESAPFAEAVTAQKPLDLSFYHLADLLSAP